MLVLLLQLQLRYPFLRRLPRLTSLLVQGKPRLLRLVRKTTVRVLFYVPLFSASKEGM